MKKTKTMRPDIFNHWKLKCATLFIFLSLFSCRQAVIAFGGGIVDSIGSLFGGDSGGGFLDSITSGIGDFFGGFFANGGNLAPGKFGVVGERGPEFIGGPASITPMSGSTNVTYNIQAVDARSFQQLLASDPSFIYALTEQGRRSMAGGR